MTVNIGDKPLADFTKPIEMLKDCHRRIEHFLEVIAKVVAQFGERDLTEEARRALQASLDYFATFAPRHTADEEVSLFPRMREKSHADARDVMAELDHLERDHRRAEVCHQRVDDLARHWLQRGRLDKSQLTNLQSALDELIAMYVRHIRLEEEQVFVLASRLLPADQLQEMGEEMKQRRSLTPIRPMGSGDLENRSVVDARPQIH